MSIKKIFSKSLPSLWVTRYGYEFSKTQKSGLLMGKPLDFSCEKLIVDELILFVVPAVELSDLCAYLLRWVLSVELSHSLEVYL